MLDWEMFWDRDDLYTLRFPSNEWPWISFEKECPQTPQIEDALDKLAES